MPAREQAPGTRLLLLVLAEHLVQRLVDRNGAVLDAAAAQRLELLQLRFRHELRCPRRRAWRRGVRRVSTCATARCVLRHSPAAAKSMPPIAFAAVLGNTCARARAELHVHRQTRRQARAHGGTAKGGTRRRGVAPEHSLTVIQPLRLLHAGRGRTAESAHERGLRGTRSATQHQRPHWATRRKQRAAADAPHKHRLVLHLARALRCGAQRPTALPGAAIGARATPDARRSAGGA